MSALRPANKQPRLAGPQVKKMESVPPHPDTSEGKDLPTAFSQTQGISSSDPVTMKKTENHPRGHKVRDLDEVWKMMDAQGYLRLTDTLTLGDVWVQPKSIGEDGVATFAEIVVAPNIKIREASARISADDLLQMLYLNDCLICDMEGQTRLGFDEWLSEKAQAMMKVHGMDDATNRIKIANFILTEDANFTFYPPSCRNVVSMFFRKTCYHSYQHPTNKTNPKVRNPSMMKRPTRGKFEFVIEARMFVIPEEWRAPLTEKEGEEMK